jgi:hypothetical protein
LRKKEVIMEMESRKCKIENQDFESGAEVCDEKLCYVCADGDWEKMGALDLPVRGL